MLGNNATVGRFGVNLRDEPTTNSMAIQRLTPGHPLMLDAYTRGSSYYSADGRSENTWLRLQGTTDWVAAGYVDGEVLSNLTYVNLGKAGQYGVNLRDEPTTQSSVIRFYSAGSSLTFDAYTQAASYDSSDGRKDTTWLRVNGTSDWVAAGYVDGENLASLTYIDFSANQTGRVGQYGVNLRDEPATQSQRILTYDAGTLLTFDAYTRGSSYFSSDGTTDSIWLRVSNTTDWVAAGYIDGENLPGLAYIDVTINNTGRVGQYNVNLRDEPTTQSALLRTYSAGTSLTFDAYTRGASYYSSDGSQDSTWLRINGTSDCRCLFSQSRGIKI